MITDRARAYLRDNPFLKGAVVVFSTKLSVMLDDWTTQHAFESPQLHQKTSKIWAEVMHHFAQTLILDLYSLPVGLISQWAVITNIVEPKSPLTNLGQWALSYKLHDPKSEAAQKGEAAEEPPTTATKFTLPPQDEERRSRRCL